MQLVKTDLPGVMIIEHDFHQDNRGSFTKVMQSFTYHRYGAETDFQECFSSTSVKNVIRGMHYQRPPYHHSKVVWVPSGEILDVVVCINRNRSEFGQVFSTVLSSDIPKGIYMDSNYAHGFLTLSDKAMVMYLTTSVHSPEHDSGVRWDSINFKWGVEDPIMSDRDKAFPALMAVR